MTKKYDSTVARMAGNIAAGMMATYLDSPNDSEARATVRASIANISVYMARLIIAEVVRTEPAPEFETDR
jgi:hypothetical protein